MQPRSTHTYLSQRTKIRVEAKKLINAIKTREHPDITSIDSKGVEKLYDTFLGKLLVGGSTGNMFCVALTAYTIDYLQRVQQVPFSENSIYSIFCATGMFGLYAGYQCADKLPCSPFQECNRLEELHKEYKALKNTLTVNTHMTRS